MKKHKRNQNEKNNNWTLNIEIYPKSKLYYKKKIQPKTQENP